MNWRTKRTSLFFTAIALVVIVVVLYFVVFYKQHVSNKISIVLSQHYDDAALSLGGLLAKEGKNALVVSFFTDGPDTATTTNWDMRSGLASSTDPEKVRSAENETSAAVTGARIQSLYYRDNQYSHTQSDEDLIVDISKDIQLLLAAYSGYAHIDVYGPATFGPGVTHPDHQLLHRAYVNVAKDYPNVEINFYIYEDFPYVTRFNKDVVKSLQGYMQDVDGLYLERQQIDLSKRNVTAKLKAIGAYKSQVKAFASYHTDILKAADTYTTNRCDKSGEKPCEVVYWLRHFSE